jgi:hypothetical protein
METESLTDLISKKEFDNYQDGLEARFSADRMDYDFHYSNKETINSLTVNLSKNEKITRIEISEDGILTFDYMEGKEMINNKFNNCNSEDFHTMLAHAFIFIRDGNFDYHKEWYNNLNKISS